jgi:hypothetical protein
MFLIRLPLAMLALALVSCDRGPRLEYGPCVPGRVGHVQRFGYFGSASALAELTGYSNLSWGGASALPAARTAGVQAVVDVSVFHVTSATPPADAVIAANWAALAAQLTPDLVALAALYVSDEPYMSGEKNGVAPAEVQRRLESAARLVHSTAGFETVRLAIIFSDRCLDLLEAGAAGMPAGYAWVGWDLYAVHIDHIDDRVSRFLSFVRPDQRIIVVPDAFIWRRQFGENALHHMEALRTLEARIAFWLAWTEDHPQVVAVAPFIYSSSVEWLGARDLPPVKARYEQIGSCILAANAPK